MQISLFLLLLNLSTPALAIEEEIPATEENAIRQITAMIREQVKKEAEKMAGPSVTPTASSMAA